MNTANKALLLNSKIEEHYNTAILDIARSIQKEPFWALPIYVNRSDRKWTVHTKLYMTPRVKATTLLQAVLMEILKEDISLEGERGFMDIALLADAVTFKDEELDAFVEGGCLLVYQLRQKQWVEKLMKLGVTHETALNLNTLFTLKRMECIEVLNKIDNVGYEIAQHTRSGP